jgi:hypothetical protein
VAEIAAILAGLDDLIEHTVIGLTTEVEANLISPPPGGTPIDLGWARAGWVPSVGKPYLGGADLDPTPAKVSVALARQAEGIQEVLAYRLTDGLAWVSSNVRYIQVLNEGHSGQSPAGFVQIAIANAVREVSARP